MIIFVEARLPQNSQYPHSDEILLVARNSDRTLVVDDHVSFRRIRAEDHVTSRYHKEFARTINF